MYYHAFLIKYGVPQGCKYGPFERLLICSFLKLIFSHCKKNISVSYHKLTALIITISMVDILPVTVTDGNNLLIFNLLLNNGVCFSVKDFKRLLKFPLG